MSKLILDVSEDEVKGFKSYEEMFQYISEQGKIVLSVKDGEIETKDGLKMSFGVIEGKGSKVKFIKEIDSYRESLRKTIGPLIKQGIVTKEQIADKLKDQFEFINEKTEGKK